ncbi:MAG: hypothetical protein ISP67_03610 [Flavobacteriaceae bacterium]|jgi:hypothetical protein|nr:hypothetical protein [Flavobacteriaceae bacterium]
MTSLIKLSLFSDPQLLIPTIALLLPIVIVLIVSLFKSRDQKNKYQAIIEVSKNINDSEDIKELLDSLQEKKSNTDLRRSGVVTIFVGIGLFCLGYFGLNIKVLYGVGLLVSFIGIGQMIAGYIYPNQSEEINRTVESFEKK